MIIGDLSFTCIDLDDYIENNEEVILNLFKECESIIVQGVDEDYDEWIGQVVCLASILLMNSEEHFNPSALEVYDEEQMHKVFNVLLVYYYVNSLKQKGFLK
jgi:hypothetical protein